MFLPFYDSNPKQNITLQIVTVGLIAVNVAMFVGFQGTVMDYPDFRLALIPITLFESQVRPPEDAMGHVKFLVFFLLCGLAGGLAYAVMTPGPASPLVGASGATSGVVAAYLMLHPRVKVWVLATLLVKIPLRLPAWIVLGAYVIWNVAMVVTGETLSSTAWWAHIGGLVAGAALTPLFKRRDVPLFDRGMDDREAL